MKYSKILNASQFHLLFILKTVLKILIRLCNVPLLQTDDDFAEISSTEKSSITFAFISAKNYLCINQIRVKVIIADPDNDNHYVERYVNFDDIHEIKTEI